MTILRAILHRRNMKRIQRDIERGRTSVLCGSQSFPESQDVVFTETVNHAALMIPSDCQGNHPSCGGHALANWVEWRMNGSGRFVPEGHQVDGYEIWKRKRLKNYGHLIGGLRMDEIAEAGIELDLFKGDYSIVSAAEALKILPYRPLICGIDITTEWPRASKTNGFIDPGGRTTGPHAEVLVGATINEGRKYVHLLNSWGTAHGWKGIDTITLEMFLERCFACVDIRAKLTNPEKFLKRWRG